MPTTILSLKSAHKCYRCHKLIKRGESAIRWDYADKKMYRHVGICPIKESFNQTDRVSIDYLKGSL